tara:strand:- start:111 stop:731 length:621 start_codon:yes stop_codon:yes gene_type:complete
MIPLFIRNLSQKLKSPLPGKKAHEIMMVTPKISNFNLNQKEVPAAVLLLLFPVENNWHFFLTKRTNTLEHHKGQIALPGGMVEEGENLEQAAIRETYEEIGVSIDPEKLIGSLSPFYIPVSGFKIFPFIGWLESEPKTTIHEREVQRIFSPSIHHLISKDTKKNKEKKISGNQINIPYFDLEGEEVWGATSIILSEFKVIIKDIYL